MNDLQECNTLYYVCDMKEKEQLIKVSTYARLKKKSLAWAYKQIREDQVQSKIIDGVTFIIINGK